MSFLVPPNELYNTKPPILVITKFIPEINSWIYDISLNSPRIGGGLVGDPNLFITDGVEILPGVKSKFLHRHVIDLDLTAHYPSSSIYGNISKHSLYGRLRAVDGKRLEVKEKGRFNDVVINDDLVLLGNEYFDLPTMSDILLISSVDKETGDKSVFDVDETNIKQIKKLNNILKKFDSSKKDIQDTKTEYSILGKSAIAHTPGVWVTGELSETSMSDIFTDDCIINGSALHKRFLNKELEFKHITERAKLSSHPIDQLISVQSIGNADNALEGIYEGFIDIGTDVKTIDPNITLLNLWQEDYKTSVNTYSHKTNTALTIINIRFEIPKAYNTESLIVNYYISTI